MREPLESSVRVLTLVPVDVAVKAITVFGETNRSAKLIEALGYDRPSEWDEAGEEEGKEESLGDALPRRRTRSRARRSRRARPWRGRPR